MIYSVNIPVEPQFIVGDIPDKDYGEYTHFDIETTGLDRENGKILVVSIGYNAGEDGSFRNAIICHTAGSEECPPNLKKYFLGKTNKIIHNASFDASWVKYHWDIRIQNVLCTKVLARMLRNNCNTYSKLVRTIEGIELPKGDISTSPWEKPFELWTEEMRKYCAYDVVFGLKILNFLKTIASEETLERYSKISKQWPTLVNILTNIQSGDLRYI